MNIIIPLAGPDREFADAGLYKPLVEIAGKPLIRHCTDNYPALFAGGKNRLAFIVLAEHDRRFGAAARLRELYGADAQVLVLPEATQGAAATVLAAKETIDNPGELVVYLADIYFEADLEAAIARCRSEKLAGFIPCFPSSNRKYSYAAADKAGMIGAVAEKEAISANASAGFYYFSHGSDFVRAAKEMIRRNLRVNGSFYVCPVYNQLILEGKKILMLPARYRFGLGNLSEIGIFRKHADSPPPEHRSLIYAHRGMAGGKNPENSPEALAQAVLAGYSVELDVRRTSDGVLVVSHDSELMRGFGKSGRIEETPYAELAGLDYFAPGCRIARFGDFLGFFKANSGISCELAIHAKAYDHALGEMIVQALLAQTLTERAFIFDISAGQAGELKEKYPFARTGASIVDGKVKEMAGRPNYYCGDDLASLAEFDVLWIDEWKELYSESFLSRAIATQKEVVAISPELHRADGNRKEPEAVWAKLINSGCMKICTDYPGKLDRLMAGLHD